MDICLPFNNKFKDLAVITEIMSSNKDISEDDKRMITDLSDLVDKVFGIKNLPRGIEANTDPDKVYSSIIDKFIDIKTGLPVEEK